MRITYFSTLTLTRIPFNFHQACDCWKISNPFIIFGPDRRVAARTAYIGVCAYSYILLYHVMCRSMRAALVSVEAWNVASMEEYTSTFIYVRTWEYAWFWVEGVCVSSTVRGYVILGQRVCCYTLTALLLYMYGTLNRNQFKPNIWTSRQRSRRWWRQPPRQRRRRRRRRRWYETPKYSTISIPQRFHRACLCNVILYDMCIDINVYVCVVGCARVPHTKHIYTLYSRSLDPPSWTGHPTQQGALVVLICMCAFVRNWSKNLAIT